MTARRLSAFLVFGLLAVGAAHALDRPPDDGTVAEVVRSNPDREWVRVYEDGRFGAVYRFRPDGVLVKVSGGDTSWRTWEISDGRLLLNGETPCIIEASAVIRGDAGGRFVLVPRTAPNEVPLPEPPRRLRVRIFVDGSSTLFVRGAKLWLRHHSHHRPGTGGGRGPTWVNDRPWTPQWKGAVASPVEWLDPGLPTVGEPVVWIAKTKGRGTYTVKQTPGPHNDHVLSITIDDELPGACWYEFTITW